MLGWMSYKLELRQVGETSTILDTGISLMAESEEELKSLLMRVKEKSERGGWKLSTKKNQDLGIWPH